ncbi:glycine cleavage system protein H [Listeria floridensis FSL S10-1187]|uniref:Glycine cleavage system H protein n=1 Tax=Listeria floridensis FSL S10-1187 TaxID=1265817 RepID=A0ABP3AXH3_9LIST|nr:glycine cleavage system protein GcvH [Listeria floridensis]EUJ31361.1 glycine cleavage system protein H [Listeria floridensis FSL S10-1187]
MVSIPETLKYSSDDEWVKKDGDTYLIGITDFAQDQLGDIVFVEVPEVGDKIDKDESYGSVESVKTVSDLLAPISFEVVAVNEALDDAPETINSDPYEAGWILKVKAVEESEVEDLLTHEDYQKRVDEA